jgi:glycosyltransferase involved in cell wall biosynthesis
MAETDRPLRVLYVSSFGGFRGGGQHSLLLLIERIARLEVTPIVAAPQEGDFLAAVRAHGCPTHVRPLPSLRPWTLFRVGETVAAIRDLLAAERIDLVHTDGPRSTLLYGRAARPTGRPLAFHIRVSDREPAWLERWLARSADALLCVSSGAAERFRRFAPQKIHLVPNGVDLTAFVPGIAPSDRLAALRERGDEIVIGEIAFLTPRKGQDLLITAVAGLPPTLRDRVRLVLVGAEEPAFGRRCRKLASRSGMGSRVHFLGPLSDVRPVLAGLDLVALPSFGEGLPRTLLEAAAMGRALVASDVAGCREVVVPGRTGLLLPARKVGAWREGLAGLLSGNAWRSMGAAGREFVAEHFDLEEVAPRVVAIYRDLLGSGKEGAQ